MCRRYESADKCIVKTFSLKPGNILVPARLFFISNSVAKLLRVNAQSW